VPALKAMTAAISASDPTAAPADGRDASGNCQFSL
jgi:hypothetical protein